MAHVYDLARGDVVRGLFVAGALLGADVALKLLARASCDEVSRIDASALARVFSPPDACTGIDLAGPLLRLSARARDGGWLDLADRLAGFPGQAWGLCLLLLATLLTILVARWQWRASGDAAALATVWVGALLDALPRLTGDGRGLSEIELAGRATGLCDLALAWGLLWLGWRVVGELRG